MNVQDAYFGDVLITDPNPDRERLAGRDRDAILALAHLSTLTDDPAAWLRDELDALGLAAIAVDFRAELVAERTGVPVPPAPEPVKEPRPKRVPPVRPPAEIAHGTARGYRHHRRRGEDPCEPCREALRVEGRERRASRRPLGARDMTPPKCGTMRGWRHHHTKGTPVCAECRLAKSTYSKNQRAAQKAAGS